MINPNFVFSPLLDLPEQRCCQLAIQPGDPVSLYDACGDVHWKASQQFALFVRTRRSMSANS